MYVYMCARTLEGRKERKERQQIEEQEKQEEKQSKYSALFFFSPSSPSLVTLFLTDGCTEIAASETMGQHEKNCPFAPVTCKYR